MQVIMDFSNRAVKVPNLAIDYAAGTSSHPHGCDDPSTLKGVGCRV